jgi:uncharacterized protein YgiM (DUF1202 family)
MLLLFGCLPVTALAGWSTTSNTGVDLVYPTAGQYLDTPLTATVKASRENGSIYLMPMPKSGNGNLGTVRNGTTVTILAQKSGYYYFVISDGRSGWNGAKFFTVIGPAEQGVPSGGNSGSGSDSGRRSAGWSTTSNTGVDLVYPTAGQYLAAPLSATIKASRENGSIYLMPMPKTGNGNLGTVRNGTTVTILAKKADYYFFETPDGRMGWNGSRFFTIGDPVSPGRNSGTNYDWLEDGQYYGQLYSWNDASMTVELLRYAGRLRYSQNYDLRGTGQIVTLDIGWAEVYLESAWFPNIGEAYCGSIDDALDTWVFDGTTRLWEQCTMQIRFTVMNGGVTKIVFLYAA